MKARKTLAILLAAICLVCPLSACGAESSTADTSSSKSRREEAEEKNSKRDEGKEESSKDDAKTEDSREETTALTTVSTAEKTTTTKTTTTEPQKAEFTPLVEPGEDITLEVLEEVLPNIFGLGMEEATEGLLTALSITPADVEVIDTADDPESMYYVTIPDGYDNRLTYRYDLKDCNVTVFGAECVTLVVNSYYSADKDNTFDIGLAFSESDQWDITSYLEDTIGWQEWEGWTNLTVGDIVTGSYGDGYFYVWIDKVSAVQ